MEIDRLEEVCKQLRLSHIPRVIGRTEGLETKEDRLLFLLENELKCQYIFLSYIADKKIMNLFFYHSERVCF